MAEETKKGILSKIFRVQKSSCCSMQIEEVAEAEPTTSAPKPEPSEKTIKEQEAAGVKR